ncbi:MAG: SPFH domain-containing protein [Candidatus Paceibacterota bacterium]
MPTDVFSYILSGLGYLVVAYMIAILIWGTRQVPEEKRYVIERLGRYNRTVGPGLIFFLPWIEKIRAEILISEQTVLLFTDPIKFDFKDGSATPKQSEAFVRIKSPETPYLSKDGKNESGAYRALYEIRNWEKAIKSLLENAIRSYLNGLTVDEGITEKGAGFDLRNKLPAEEVARIQDSLDGWGFGLVRITIMDFDLDKKIIDARDDVQSKHRQVDAAKFERERMAEETVGALLCMVALSMGEKFEDIQKKVREDQDLQKQVLEFSQELVTRQMSLDGKSLIDIRTSGGGDVEQLALRVIGLFKSKLSDNGGQRKEDKGDQVREKQQKPDQEK